MGKHWDWAPVFLLALERSGLIRPSARACGVGRRTVYDRRASDPEFAARWDAVLAPFLRGEREYSRRALAPFPMHAALKPLDTLSADLGAVNVDELERRLGCSLEVWAAKIERVAGRDKGTRAVLVRYSDGVRALAARARARDARAQGANRVKAGPSCAVLRDRTAR